MPRYHTRGSIGSDMTLGSKEDVIEAMCQMAGVVNENVFQWGYPSDCFCDIANDHPDQGSRFFLDRHIWDFIKEAVEGAMQTELNIQERIHIAVMEERAASAEAIDELESQLAMTKLP